MEQAAIRPWSFFFTQLNTLPGSLAQEVVRSRTSLVNTITRLDVSHIYFSVWDSSCANPPFSLFLLPLSRKECEQRYPPTPYWLDPLLRRTQSGSQRLTALPFSLYENLLLGWPQPHLPQESSNDTCGSVSLRRNWLRYRQPKPQEGISNSNLSDPGRWRERSRFWWGRFSVPQNHCVSLFIHSFRSLKIYLLIKGFPESPI